MSETYDPGEYFNRLNGTFARHRKNVEKSPPREVQLLKAMKAFAPEERHKGMDSMIDAMMLSRTLESIREEARVRREGLYADGQSVHPDGIYDVDAACLAGRGGHSDMRSVMLMAMVAMAGR